MSKNATHNYLTTRLKKSLAELNANDSVVGYIFMNEDGVPIKTSMDRMTANRHCALVQGLVSSAKVVDTISR